jgi:high-affinity iron transporter
MTLIYAALTVLALAHAPGTDSLAAGRRIAASVQLAAQEYRNGVSGGKVTSPAEVAEARLFLVEARRTAQVLPAQIAAGTIADIDRIVELLARTAAPDSVAASARLAADHLAVSLGTPLDEIPDYTPSLKRGAEVFRRDCAGCHGELGRGDGVGARALNPPPADLTDARSMARVTPLEFYQRVTIGVAGTAMPAFETRLPPADRWAVALYASTLRQTVPAGDVPGALRAFATVAVLTDSAVLGALGPMASPARLAAVRAFQPGRDERSASAATFTTVRDKITSALSLANAGQHDQAASTAFDAYLEFEKVETVVQAKNPDLATRLEAEFATLRIRAAGGAARTELVGVERELFASLEQAERVVSDRMSPINLFLQSLVIILREGLEAILIIGALIAFLTKAGAAHRKRDIHVGVGAAVAMSLLTAVLLETVFVLSAAHREALEGLTMIVAVGVLFYVSYWLLSKMEVAKWTAFVKQRLAVAVTGGSAFALASAAFLAVYREGFETVLFYKALFVEGGALSDTFVPVTAGIAVGAVALALVYIAINRWGVRLPLKPFFGITSGFLYYMAFVFAGKGIAELQDGGVVPNTILLGWPRVAALGIYPTVESMLAQAVMALLAGVALVWIFGVQRRRDALAYAAGGQPETPTPTGDGDPSSAPRTGHPEPEELMLRSLERMEADLGALQAEVERLRQTVVDTSADEISKH